MKDVSIIFLSSTATNFENSHKFWPGIFISSVLCVLVHLPNRIVAVEGCNATANSSNIAKYIKISFHFSNLPFL